MNKVLITGGCGFIGFHMINKLIKKNNIILNLDFLGYASSKKDLNYKKNYSFINADIKNFAKLKKIIFEFSPNYILNFAAESHVDNSIVKNSLGFGFLSKKLSLDFAYIFHKKENINISPYNLLINQPVATFNDRIKSLVFTLGYRLNK